MYHIHPIAARSYHTEILHDSKYNHSTFDKNINPIVKQEYIANTDSQYPIIPDENNLLPPSGDITETLKDTQDIYLPLALSAVTGFSIANIFNNRHHYAKPISNLSAFTWGGLIALTSLGAATIYTIGRAGGFFKKNRDLAAIVKNVS